MITGVQELQNLLDGIFNIKKYIIKLKQEKVLPLKNAIAKNLKRVSYLNTDLKKSLFNPHKKTSSC